ncbi:MULTISPECIES: peptidase inhibitor family I36 protein [Embleya]|uniref:peptidase inhibitor family I36 protein n=1 Tax=Embleya TaxID=2699295 RepID=UPI00135CA5A3|nr:peptidase inhibitor family I36 protein [Embleya hyalina]
MADRNVTVHTERGYRGRSQTLKPGAYDASELKEGEDTISSVRVPDGWTVCLYEDPNFTGRSKLLTSSTDYVGDDFNNVTSSLIVADPAATEDIDVDAKSLMRLTQGFPPKYEQVMVLSFTMVGE